VAARRLLILMLVVLGISTLAAALVPVERQASTETTSTETAATKPATDHRGRLLTRRLDASGGPRVVRMHLGDQLRLIVQARRADIVEVRGTGEVHDVDRYTPARFDLLPFERGTYPIRLLDAHRTIGRIVVTKPRRAT
jgi:hypothetical protein